MNNIDLILDSIKNDAKKEADDILSNAKKEAEELIKNKEEEARKQADKILEKANQEASLLLENSKTTANREARDIKINAQHKVVDRVLAKLKDRLKNLNDEDYKKYILNSLKNMKISNAEILLQEDKKNVIKESDLSGLKISTETVEEGFVVRSGKIEYDNRFTSLVDYNKDSYEKIVMDEIFK